MRAGVCTALLIAIVAFPQSALAKPKPDLVVSELRAAPGSIAAGSELTIEETVRNRGRSRAGKSATRFYLSPDLDQGQGDTRLHGKRRVPKLGRHEGSSGESEPKVPLDTPQEGLYLLACADDRKEVKEKREENNCRASSATIDIELPDDCTDRLTALGIEFEHGPNNPGVTDPVTVETPISGISYSNSAGVDVDELYMDCSLALSLHDMAAVMNAHGLVGVQQAGIYAYRCISDPGPPPDCPNGISRHAYGDAIDILAVRSLIETFTVNDDWVIDPDPEETCLASTSGAKDALLHAFVCELFEGAIFNVLLTPNYNAAHRNHFHLDLTPSVSFIR
jgi:hypothetical protein